MSGYHLSPTGLFNLLHVLQPATQRNAAHGPDSAGRVRLQRPHLRQLDVCTGARDKQPPWDTRRQSFNTPGWPQVRNSSWIKTRRLLQKKHHLIRSKDSTTKPAFAFLLEPRPSLTQVIWQMPINASIFIVLVCFKHDCQTKGSCGRGPDGSRDTKRKAAVTMIFGISWKISTSQKRNLRPFFSCPSAPCGTRAYPFLQRTDSQTREIYTWIWVRWCQKPILTLPHVGVESCLGWRRVNAAGRGEEHQNKTNWQSESKTDICNLKPQTGFKVS